MDTAERGTVMDDGQRAGSASSTQRNEGSSAPASDGPLLLLALPQDRISLSETLCVVREVSFFLGNLFIIALELSSHILHFRDTEH
jgi:hypothetical protein